MVTLAERRGCMLVSLVRDGSVVVGVCIVGDDDRVGWVIERWCVRLTFDVWSAGG